MITYKNITDVEVLNEMPEGATALVNDDGELKQVACEKMGSPIIGGGVATAFFKQDGYDNVLAGVAVAHAAPERTYTCINMTFDEACQVVMSGQPIEVIFMTTRDGGLFFQPAYNVVYGATPRLIYAETDTGISVYWTSDGISAEEPGK